MNRLYFGLVTIFLKSMLDQLMHRLLLLLLVLLLKCNNYSDTIMRTLQQHFAYSIAV